jgi:phosphatidylethanolamine-binding protein (PEBP) family uncharacterized protein
LRIWNLPTLGIVALTAAVALAGCGSSSSAKSASVAAATTATTQTTPTTPATTSTAAKPPASKSSKSAKPASKSKPKPSHPPAAKASTKPSKAANEKPTFGKIALTSSAFKAGGPIPSHYTCDGAGVSPPLQWHGVPAGTAELFLLAIDLSGSASDAIQWAVAGIPPSASGIAAGSLPVGAVVGVNSAGKSDWDGICGAKGQLHHVAFLFYALRHKLGLQPGFNPVLARDGLKGATLATGLTLTTYKRP